MKTANGLQKTKPSAGARPEPADRRRRRIVEWMRTHGGPIRGGELAKRFRVSRQSLVQDVAILRAGGEDIVDGLLENFCGMRGRQRKGNAIGIGGPLLLGCGG